MCTAIAFGKNTLFFGRNMDLEYHFGESVVITPRNFGLPTKRAGLLVPQYAMIGMASVADGYPLYAEAMNECGLCMAGLNFPDHAHYPAEASPQKTAVTPYELIPVVLGTCRTCAEAKKLLADLTLIAIPFSPTLPLAPLHWMISDAEGSLTLECTQSGMHLYDNPYGVLTNNPPFPFHHENVRQYLHLSAQSPQNAFGAELSLTPFGQGAGALGLPGDFSSASRFVKALFCKTNSICDSSEQACISQVFHSLDAVAMVRGSVITPEGKPDLTTYSCCMSAATKRYYYKTYENSQITQIELTEERNSHKGLLIFPPRTQQAIFAE